MIIDAIAIGVTLISSIIAFLRGFIREMMTILGFVGGALAAIMLGPDLVPIVERMLFMPGEEPGRLFDMIPMGWVITIGTYGGVFLIVLGILSMVSHLSSSFVKAIGLGAIDRTLGVIFGMVRAVIILGLIYLPFHLLMDEKSKNQYFSDSRFHTYIEQTSEFMANYLPDMNDISDGDLDEDDLSFEGDHPNALQDKLQELHILQSEDTPIHDLKNAADIGDNQGFGAGKLDSQTLDSQVIDPLTGAVNDAAEGAGSLVEGIKDQLQSEEGGFAPKIPEGIKNVIEKDLLKKDRPKAKKKTPSNIPDAVYIPPGSRPEAQGDNAQDGYQSGDRQNLNDLIRNENAR